MELERLGLTKKIASAIASAQPVPTTTEELLALRGVGKVTVQKYGKDILLALQKAHLTSNTCNPETPLASATSSAAKSPEVLVTSHLTLDERLAAGSQKAIDLSAEPAPPLPSLKRKAIDLTSSPPRASSTYESCQNPFTSVIRSATLRNTLHM